MEKDELYLSKLLQGESMGIDLYHKYINRLPDSDTKREVEAFLKEHERHRNRIKNIMSTRGMKVEEKPGVISSATEAYTSIKMFLKHKPHQIVEDIYKGEIIGIRSAEEYLEEFSDSIRPEIEKIIKEDKERLNKVERLREQVK